MLKRLKLIGCLMIVISINSYANTNNTNMNKTNPPIQVQYIADLEHAILDVAELAYTKNNLATVMQENIEAMNLVLATGNIEAYQVTEKQTELPTNIDIANIKTLPEKIKIYFVKQNKQRVKVILPIYAQGYNDMIYALLAVAMDGNTITGIKFYQHAETKGIADKFASNFWQNKLKGKQIYNNQTLALYVAKKFAPKKDVYAIDGISGATYTSKSLDNLFKFWLGKQAYQPFLLKLQAGEYQ